MKQVYSMIALLLLCALLPLAGVAQTRRTTDGYTPADAQRGETLGSYPLSGFDTVNLFNRSMTFSLSLADLTGRGGLSASVPLVIDPLLIVETVQGSGQYTLIDTQAPFYATATLKMQQMSAPIYGSSPPCGQGQAAYSYVVTRFKFTDLTGAEYVFHSTASTAPYYISNVCAGSVGANRGKTFVTADATAATLVTDADVVDVYSASASMVEAVAGNATVIFRDGTRYRFDSNGLLSYIQDRNGNRVTFTNLGSTITDPNGRTISILKNNPSSGIDTIRVKGFGGANRDVKVYYSSLSGCLRQGSSVQTVQTLFPSINSPTGNFNPTRVSQVELPNGTSYYFRYNSYGELARVILPTGGGYDYEYTDEVGGGGFDASNLIIVRPLTKRTIYRTLALTDDPANPTAANVERKEIYSLVTGATNTRVTQVETRDGNNVLQAQTKHHFHDVGYAICSAEQMPPWSNGKEFKVEQYQVTGGSLGSVAHTVEHTWSPTPPTSFSCSATPPSNPKIVETKTTLNDVNLVSKQTFVYDSYHNRTEVWEYDFGSGSPGSLLRKTVTSFLTTNPNQSNANYATDTGIHIRNLPVQVSVYDAGGTERARTVFDYDNYGTYSLTDRSGIVQHDSNYSTSYQKRGNATSVTRHVTVGGSTTVTYSKFDIAGNLVKIVDPRGKATDFDFSDNFGLPDGSLTHSAPSELSSGQYAFAFPTKTTNAIGHESFRQYSYYLGEIVDTEDANGVKTSKYYDDALDRMTKQISAVGLSAQMQTFYTYDDANRKVIVENDQSASNDKNLKSVSKYDGLGRTTRLAKKEDSSNWSIIDTEYDALGRAYRTSNAYRSTNYDTATTPSGTWTTTSFDGLGRVTQVQTPDGATSTATYSGNATTVQDPASKKKKTVVDALGRATSVILDPGGSAEATTAYVYNVFDKVVKSTQTDGSDTQYRYWLYDGLGRLKAARYPEQAAPHSITDTVSGNNSWSNVNTYDANGNITEILDARSVSTYFGFDDINRMEGYAYSDSSDVVNFYYDRSGLTYGKGRLDYAESLGSINGVGLAYSKVVVDTYDPFGRVKKQTTSMSNSSGTYQRSYPVEQTYNLVGQVTQVKYPSGKTVDTTFDVAGRVATMSGNIGAGFANYVTGVTYNPSHLPLKETWGTNTTLYLNRHYNIRLQNYDIRLGTSSTNEWGFDRGALFYYYSSDYHWDGDGTTGATGNNGNIWRAHHFFPLDNGVQEWVIATQYYTYDAFNRLKDVEEFSETYLSGVYNYSSSVFKQIYLYDNFGNRRIDATNSTGPINKKAYDINKATNRVVVPSGQTGTITYDNAGNMVYDSYTTAGGSANRQFDGSSRLRRSYDNGQVDYVYDMNGKRSRKRKGSVETWYVYGIQGELLAEYNYNTAATSPQKEYAYKDGQLLIYGATGDNIKWVVNDILGTPRMFVDWWGDLNGSAGIQRHDYLPFGEELLAGIGVRTTGRGYPAATVSGKGFTGQYHDNETALDYFGARYYNNIAGRFISVDPLDASGRIGGPQTWNRYSYVSNMPLAYVDPSGMQQEIVYRPDKEEIEKKRREKKKRKQGVPGLLFLSGGFGSERNTRDLKAFNGSLTYQPRRTERSGNFVAASMAVDFFASYGEAIDVYHAEAGLSLDEYGKLVNALRDKETIIIYGYSHGAAEAVEIAGALTLMGVHVDALILVDPPNVLGAANGVATMRNENISLGVLVTSGNFALGASGASHPPGFMVMEYPNAGHIEVGKESKKPLTDIINRLLHDRGVQPRTHHKPR